MEMISKVRSFLTTWEEEAYPGIIAIQNNTRDKKMYEKYYGILLTLYESKYEKLVDPSIFVNADGSLNLGNTPVMAILKDMICGCKRGTECVRKNPDHLKLMHGLHVSPEIRVIFSCSADYPVKGGKRRKTLRKRIKQKKNKRTAKQRS
jgi:hypothetical protein